MRGKWPEAGKPVAQPLNYLALGDSYTIGESVPEGGCWPMQVAAALRERGVTIGQPRIIATTGWSTDELSAAMDTAEPLGAWDLVSLLIGVNNQYRGRDVADYAREFAALLERAIALTGGRAHRVLVLSIPDWGVTPFGQASGRDTALIAAELDAYNAAASGLCAARGVAFVDITSVSRASGAHPDGVATDGLHPSPTMYGAWARLALPVAISLLR